MVTKYHVFYFQNCSVKKNVLVIEKNFENFARSLIDTTCWYLQLIFKLTSADISWSKFFIMSTEFDKNISDWSHYCTDHKNGNDFFMSLVKWPKIAVKKANFLEILGTKVVQFWSYTKSEKTKNVPLNCYFSTKIFFRKIRVIFDVENWLWKSDFGTFWWLFLAI